MASELRGYREGRLAWEAMDPRLLREGPPGRQMRIARHTSSASLIGFARASLRRSHYLLTDLMRRAAGDAGNFVLSLIVVVSALSTLNGTIFTGARVYHALGQDFEAATRFTAWNLQGENPANGLLLQGVIALCLVAFGATERSGFQAMVDYTAPVFWLFLLLVGISLFVLRWKNPERQLPFSVPLYPLTPILFCATCIYMIYASVSYTGIGALVGLAVLVAGLPLLLLAPSRENGAAPS